MIEFVLVSDLSGEAALAFRSLMLWHGLPTRVKFPAVVPSIGGYQVYLVPREEVYL